MVVKLRFLFLVLILCNGFIIASIRAQSPIDSVLSQHLKDISDQYATQPDSAIAIFNALLNTLQYKNDKERKSTILISVGREYVYRKHQHAIALQYFNQSLELARSAHNCHLELRAIIHVNLVHFELKEMTTFFRNYEYAAEQLSSCPNFKDAYYVYIQLGLCYQQKNMLNKAEYCFLKADSAATKTQNHLTNEQINFTYIKIIEFYKQLGNQGKMQVFAQKAIENHIKNKNSEILNYYYLAAIYEYADELDSAIYYQKLLINLNPKNYDAADQEYIYTGLSQLSEYYVKKNDFQNAFAFKKRYAEYLDSLVAMSKSVNANQQINLLKNQLENAQKEQKLERNRWLLLLSLILFLVAVVAVYLIYRYNQKLKRLNHQLEYQKEALDLQNNIRTKMFLVLSHDLVSPLAALQSMIGLFGKGIVDKTDVQSYTSDMKQHLDALLTTIKSLLDWSLIQLKGDKPVIKPVALRHVVDTQFNLHNSLASQKNIQLINNIPPYFTLLADLNHLNLITRNLIDNAIKYTENNGEITVNAFDTVEPEAKSPPSTRGRKGGKILTISDTGRGMSAEEIGNILNADKKTINNNQNEAHLGLKMVQDLLVANGYSLSIESEKGVGSVFSIEFGN